VLLLSEFTTTTEPTTTTQVTTTISDVPGSSVQAGRFISWDIHLSEKEEGSQ